MYSAQTRTFFCRNIPIFILLGVILILFWQNYEFGTWLIGWDSLHPELNFKAAIERSLFSVWQEYRGVGLFDGMAHGANILHTIVVYVLSIVLPDSLVRYVFLFGMHFLGGLGIYALTKKLLKNTYSSFFAALFYLLSLSTIQMFYTPFEVFAVHFAFLPWLALGLTNYLTLGTFRSLLFFAVLVLLSLPQAFVPTVFVVFLLMFFSIVFLKLIDNFNFYWKRVLLAAGVVFVLNSYWLLPYVSGLPSNGQTIIDAKINQMSSRDVRLQNNSRGGLFDVLTFKGSVLDVQEFGKDGKVAYVMQEWRQHIKNPVFLIPAILFMVATLLGLFMALFFKETALYPFIASYIFAFVFLANDVILLEQLNNFLRSSVPFLSEAFRFSFTKFITLFTLSSAIFFGRGLSLLFNLFVKYAKVKLVLLEASLFVGILFFFYSLPAFSGSFFYDSLRLKVPQEQFGAVKFFQNQNHNERVATLPQPTFWSWRFNDWGYRGSGFFWQAIDQPLLDRAFDPWSKGNENYYWELSYALYSENSQLFEKVFEKYQIKWLVLDRSTINPPSPKALYLDELESVLSNSEKFTLEGEFGKVKVYKVHLQTPINNYVFLANNLPFIGPETKWNNNDRSYSDNGNYINQAQSSNVKTQNLSAYYPFRSLFTNKTQEDLEFTVEDLGDSYLLRKTVPAAMSDWKLDLQELGLIELVWIDLNDMTKFQVIVPDITFNGREVLVKFPKIAGLFRSEINPVTDKVSKRAKNCNSTRGLVKNQIIKEEDGLAKRLIAKDANNCSAAYYLENLPHGTGYLVGVESRNVKGKSLMFWIENSNTRKSDLETYLPDKKGWQTSYFVQPPMEKDGAGYALHFDNISIGADQTINDLRKVSIYPFPYKLLTSMYLHPKDLVLPQQEISTVETEHKTPDVYRVTLATPSTGTLVLSQAYHDGWKAYRGNFQFSIFNFQYLAPIFGREIKEHVKVNNWENGWQLPENTTRVTILFLPQYLQFLGYFLAIGSIIALLVPSVRRRIS
ncbi:MAG: hypothetical protein A3A58_03320 [Candidatus Blackburnbacteria bacterium RIFCSPLOWO2_01_FULL_41_27]|uniref:Membrane protein 6-pyruvoyl-tetrahydropterin synthase-related domain-containing protein n=2 Tax=Candidatus Blackburniibacteriota TaxID=1817898 RepID=A0A1G1VBG8_9BACT|nr:MAG: hypothetical protein A3F61_01475 [Candidatus Blackburnbacteria bacterium RIFCSPHIGHO2_12_FULL_41_13b]OGY13978.1 MAG: hypothetical protein A3A58_03320 [Candidatus Blackburnbacteria bacterium RIFCSPLOWO2_01_FULL_41_27]